MLIPRYLPRRQDAKESLVGEGKMIDPRNTLIFLLLVGTCAAATELIVVDMIIEGDYVVPMTSKDALQQDASVVVDEGQIVAIGDRRSIAKKYQAKTVLSGKDRIVLPGIVNGHTHAAMTLFRGMADDLDLMEWLTNYIFPLEGKYVDEDFVRLGTELACLEMVKGGTTTTVDMYFFPNVAAQVFEECGMRALISTFESSTGMIEAGESVLAGQTVQEIRRSWEVTTDRVHPIISAHAIYTIPTEELLVRREISNRLGLAINIHVAESQDETEGSLADYGMTPVSYLDSIGFFEGDVVAAHMVYPTEDEIKLLAEKGVGVVHNPTSNMKLASGISPVVQMLDAGVNVGLGTDGAASNNDLDMWTEIHLATLLQKVQGGDSKLLPAFQAMEMATSKGAKALGLGSIIGTLEPGKQADVIQLDISDLQHMPIYDVYSHMVYVSDAHNVVNVVIDGSLVVHDRIATTMDEEAVKQQVREFETAMKEKLKEGLN